VGLAGAAVGAGAPQAASRPMARVWPANVTKRRREVRTNGIALLPSLACRAIIPGTPSARCPAHGGMSMAKADKPRCALIHPEATFAGKQGFTYLAGVSAQTAGATG